MWGNKSHEFSKSLKTCFKKLGINLLNMQYIKTLKTLKISNRKFYQFYESLIFVPFTNLDWKYRRKNEESKYEKNQNVNLEKLEYLKKVLESDFFVNCKKKIQADFFFQIIKSDWRILLIWCISFSWYFWLQVFLGNF